MRSISTVVTGRCNLQEEALSQKFDLGNTCETYLLCHPNCGRVLNLVRRPHFGESFTSTSVPPRHDSLLSLILKRSHASIFLPSHSPPFSRSNAPKKTTRKSRITGASAKFKNIPHARLPLRSRKTHPIEIVTKGDDGPNRNEIETSCRHPSHSSHHDNRGRTRNAGGAH